MIGNEGCYGAWLSVAVELIATDGYCYEPLVLGNGADKICTNVPHLHVLQDILLNDLVYYAGVAAF